MEFGVFDHLDRHGGLLADHYEDRLQIVEAYDRAGFYAYHLAEHHSTPLGMAPSPSVLLAAVAQRTRRLRFGPLVWAMPLHHPLRLIEEICMLDHLSRGRLEIGFGRTIWPQVHPPATAFPKLGLGRFIVVAPTDAEAMALARRAYLVWHASFTFLFRRHGRSQSHPRPASFDLVVERGQGIAGSPATVTEFLSSQLRQTRCNYVVGQFAFGDLTRAECLQSIGLFASDVMPALRAIAGTIPKGHDVAVIPAERPPDLIRGRAGTQSRRSSA